MLICPLHIFYTGLLFCLFVKIRSRKNSLCLSIWHENGLEVIIAFYKLYTAEGYGYLITRVIDWSWVWIQAINLQRQNGAWAHFTIAVPFCQNLSARWMVFNPPGSIGFWDWQQGCSTDGEMVFYPPNFNCLNIMIIVRFWYWYQGFSTDGEMFWQFSLFCLW